MKTTITTLTICLLGFFSFGQISFSVVSPASIAGGYNFTHNGDGTDWGLANLDNPADAVEDTCVLVDDGTPGVNAQGIPFANEGCNTLINDLTGKIAVVYRYDGVSANVCWYGTKVLMAEQAGAIGVIMINREDALIDVPGTTDGPMTSIPFAFISKSDGAILRAKLDAGEDVVAFIGNKTGLYANDAGINRLGTMSPLISATASQTSQNASEFGFDVGTTVYNYGNTTQNSVSVTATVNGPGGNWTETVGPYTIPSGDSVEIYPGLTENFPAFSFASYPDGRYTLSYNVDLGIADDSDFDNSLTYDFVISDSLIAYCNLHPGTSLPISNANYRPGGGGSVYDMCMVYDNANGSRLGAHGIYFSAVTGYNSGVSLDGEEMAINLYTWDNQFTDLNDANLAFDNLNNVAYGYYYYPSDLQDSVVFGEFAAPVQLSDNQRYLACVTPSNSQVYMGHDTGIDYEMSVNNTLQPITPINSDNGWFALGFGTDLTPSMALKVFDADEVGIEEQSLDNGGVYPNPATNHITIDFKGETATAEVSILDMSGRVIVTDEVSAIAYKKFNIQALTSGQYLVVINYNDGSQEQFKFAKR